LVARYQVALLRLAGSFVPSQAVAEEVVQDTWLAVLRGVAGFGGRSSFKTWLFRVLVNRARTAGVREHRSVPIGSAEPAVDPARFDATGHWAAPPEHWVDDADERLDAEALAGRLRDALDELPPRQREVVILRDVEGLSGEEVCDVLGVSDGNQRILLHRGRSRLRNILELELGQT
jgi:RNA polymerase sigma-70 factor (ECF subfamily)